MSGRVFKLFKLFAYKMRHPYMDGYYGAARRTIKLAFIVLASEVVMREGK